MTHRAESRWIWLTLGLMVGLMIAWAWPHEPAYADNSDRDQDFVIFTVPVGNQAAGFVDPIDAVFIIDVLTGQMRGAVLNRQGAQFASFYLLDLTKAFGVSPNAKPKFAVATGDGQLNNQGGVNLASGVIYIAERTTGKCLAFTFPWQDGPAKANVPYPMRPIHFFNWCQPKDE